MNLHLSIKSLTASFFLLTVSNRCTEKLHYKKRKEEEELDRKQKKEYKRKRCQLESKNFLLGICYLLLKKVGVSILFSCLEVDSGTMFRDQSKDKDDMDEECERSKVKRKGLELPSMVLHHSFL